jgi:hypothetical protein
MRWQRARHASRWSTTATTPTPTRCWPPSTCWPPARPALAGAGRHGRGRRPGPGEFHAEVGRHAAARGIEARVDRGCKAKGRHASAAAATSWTSTRCWPRCQRRPGRSVGAGQGLALHADGTRGAGAARRKGRAPMLLSLSPVPAVAVPGAAGLPARLPVPDLPRGAGGDDGAADRPGLRALGHPPPDRDEDRPADPRIRRAGAPGQAQHAHDGRRAGADRHRRLHRAVVRLEQPLRLGGDAGDLRLRRHRLGRRLPQGRQQGPRRHALAREVLLADADRPGRRAVPGLQRVETSTCGCWSCSCAG